MLAQEDISIQGSTQLLIVAGLVMAGCTAPIAMRDIIPTSKLEIRSKDERDSAEARAGEGPSARLPLPIDRYPKQNHDAEPDHHDKDPTGRDIEGKRLAVQAPTGTALSATAGASDHRCAFPQRPQKSS